MPAETFKKILGAVTERASRFTRSENDPPATADDVPLGQGLAEQGRQDAKKLRTRSRDEIERQGG